MTIEELQLATFSQEQINEISSKPVRKFVAQFIVPGVCGYKEQNDDVLLKDEVLQNMSDSFVNRAVIVSPHDITITKDNIMQKSVGRVIDVYKGEDSDKWFVKFDVWDLDALNKIDEGYKYVSCAYVITNSAYGGVYNWIDYNREVFALPARVGDIYSVGCNKCIRSCPVLMANVAEDNKIDVNEAMCIQCGACFDNCLHKARDYNDDTEKFLEDLKKGKKLSVIVQRRS